MSGDIRYFDVHAHYDDPKYENDFPGGAEAAIALSYERGVRGIVCAGTRIETCHSTLALAEKYPFIHAAVGIHPGDLRFWSEEEDDEVLSETEKMLSHPRVVAVGEIGLDYHYGKDDRERQIKVFKKQLDLAATYSLPVVIHDREAHGDTFDIIKSRPDVTGILHCFSGSVEMSRQLTDAGYYISIGGSVTFKNAKTVKEVAAAVPGDRLLIETDAPYLAPTPHRGEINHSGFLPLVTEALAEIRGTTAEQIAEITYENALRAYRMKKSRE